MDNKELLKLLQADDVCAPYLLKARNMSKHELIKYYVDNLDHGITSKLLTGEFLAANATEQELQSFGIYINFDGTINPKETLVLINCKARVLASNFDVCRIYCRGSNITLDVTDKAFVMVDIHEKSRLIVHNKSSNKVTVNRYDTSTIENTGNVKIETK